MNTLAFKKKYPRQYKLIIKKYGGRLPDGGLIHDMNAAICLYMSNLPHPRCEICGKKTVISSKFRTGLASSIRCSTHTNTNPFTVDFIKSMNVHKYDIIKIDSKYIVGNTLLTLYCKNTTIHINRI